MRRTPKNLIQWPSFSRCAMLSRKRSSEAVVWPLCSRNARSRTVDSGDQCNTLWGTVEGEGDLHGIYGTSGLVCGPESGPLAAMETGAVVERDRASARQARGIDSWGGGLERRISSSRSPAIALGSDIGGARRDFAWDGDGSFDPPDRGHPWSSDLDREPGNPPPWGSPHVSRR